MHARLPPFAHSRRTTLALLLLAIAAMSMGAKSCERVRRDSGCIQDGKHFDSGESFPSSDGCNTCSCDVGGQVACTLRACLPPGSCGSLLCAEDEYCLPASNIACNDLAGTCTAKPEACDASYAPVCGCDGSTYSSDCVAAMSGVAVARTGECEASSKPDAGPAGCDYGGAHHDAGASFPSDDGCNTCTCSESGDVACTERACAPSGTCGGLLGGGCAKTEYCAYPERAACGAADATGTCTKIPERCTANYHPVCGCDDKTYDNACVTAMAGVSVASQGECVGSDSGCTLGDTDFEVGTSVLCSDGCNHCTCEADKRWSSTLALCSELPAIELCDESVAATEGLNVTPLYRDGDALALSVQYGGGCFAHTFKLCYSGAFLESNPVQTPLRLVDTTGQTDSCRALPTAELVFDLTPLRELYMQSYPNGPNTLLLNLERDQINYSF